MASSGHFTRLALSESLLNPLSCIGAKKMLVIGGTPKDSIDGKRALAEYGIRASSEAVSPLPKIQAKFHRRPALLAARVRNLLRKYAQQPIVVNCVSMSFALEGERAYLPGYQVYEITSVFYHRIVHNPALKYSTIGLIVADGLTLRRILTFFEKRDFHPSLIGFADIELIDLYERSPAQGKERLLKIIDGLVDVGVNTIILGCTHLSDKNIPLEVGEGVRIIQPGLLLLQQVVQQFQSEQIASFLPHQLANN